MQGIKQLDFTFLAGPEEGRTYSFKSRTVSIGSGRGNDLVIKDRYINVEHAVVTVEPTGVVLQNRAVSGATFVNGSRIERCLIENDDQIAFGGGITLKFRATDVTDGFQAPFRTPAVSAFRLQVVGGILKGMSYDYSKEEVRIGSRRGCDLLLGDAGVEPEHAIIRVEGAEMVLLNRCDSGVKVNGTLVERQGLKNDDRIELGQSVLTFQENLGDVRLAKPRKIGGEKTPLQRMAKASTSLFKSPIFLAGMALYMSGLVFFVLVILMRTSDRPTVPFGGGFGFHSVARGIFVAKSIGQEFYEAPVTLSGDPKEGDRYSVESGKSILYDSSRPLAYPNSADSRKSLLLRWPKSPAYRRSIISDSAEANRCLSLGREHYGTRNLNPAGLYHAIYCFRRAEAYCPDSEATTKQAIREVLKTSEVELFEFFEDTWERAYIKRRSKDRFGAERLYELLRRLVPDDKNPGNYYARNAQLALRSRD